MKYFNKAGRIFDKILDYTMLASAGLVVLLALAVSEEVIVRKIFDFTWPPLFEIVEYMLLWMTFLGTAWILRKGTHVKMDAVVSRFSPKFQSLANCVTSFLCSGLLVAMTYYTTKLAVHDYQTNFQLATILNPVKWPIEIIVPTGFFLLAIQSIRNAYGDLNAYKALSRKQHVISAVAAGKEQV